ncbi:hypothetical protein B0H13DRAFT_2511074 [Mycena leptocephala]|nr:hypothetical protein B0H13DRAFT_2511074 [Mycena leptocephala]
MYAHPQRTRASSPSPPSPTHASIHIQKYTQICGGKKIAMLRRRVCTAPAAQEEWDHEDDDEGKEVLAPHPHPYPQPRFSIPASAQLEGCVSHTTQQERRVGTRSKVGAKVGTRARARAKAKAGGLSLRAGRDTCARAPALCLHRRSPTPSLSGFHPIRVLLHLHQSASGSTSQYAGLAISIHPVDTRTRCTRRERVSLRSLSRMRTERLVLPPWQAHPDEVEEGGEGREPQKAASTPIQRTRRTQKGKYAARSACAHAGIRSMDAGRGPARDGGEHHEAVEARTNAERNRALVEEGAEDAKGRLMLLG